MTSELQDLLPALERARAELDTALAGIPAHTRTRRPAPGRWSAAEVIEHLARVESAIAQLLKGMAAEARARPPAEETEPGSGLRIAGLAALRDRTRRIESLPITRPTGSLDAEAARERLGASRDALLRLLAGLDDVPLERVRVPHYVLGPLNGYEWLGFIAAHEARHAGQLREIAAALALTAPSP